ncbi:MAG: hypothetical protein ACO4BJ_09100, partial [Planctomycetota bacterium]
MQLEVLERTRRLEEAKARAGDAFDPVQERILQRLVQRQGSLVSLTGAIAADLEQELGGGEEGGESRDEAGEEDSSPSGEQGSDSGGGR